MADIRQGPPVGFEGMGQGSTKRERTLPDPLKVAPDEPVQVELDQSRFPIEDIAESISALILNNDEEVWEERGETWVQTPLIAEKAIMWTFDTGIFFCLGRDLHACYVECIKKWWDSFNPYDVSDAYGWHCHELGVW